MSRETSGERTRLRQTQRARIEQFFRAHLGLRNSSADLHAWFGPSFRSRVSEINRDASSRIRILNETAAERDGCGVTRERSAYWSELVPKVQWPATSEQLEELGYVYLGGKRCECGEDFLWWKTPAGKAMPLSVIRENRLVPHHARCNARRFRAADTKRAARAPRQKPRSLQISLF